jgi:hypothetical protein
MDCQHSNPEASVFSLLMQELHSRSCVLCCEACTVDGTCAVAAADCVLSLVSVQDCAV